MLPLAHHNLVVALPAFGPVLLVTLVLAIHAFRNREEKPRNDASDARHR
jgi:hypothetical protein